MPWAWLRDVSELLIVLQVFNYLAGSLSRIFTTLQEVDDNLILYGFIAGFILNLILALQMIYYWNSPTTATHTGEIGEKPNEIAMGKTTGASASPKAKSPSTRRRG
jgi:mannose-P-dolichol utilization defect protein 1